MLKYVFFSLAKISRPGKNYSFLSSNNETTTLVDIQRHPSNKRNNAKLICFSKAKTSENVSCRKVCHAISQDEEVFNFILSSKGQNYS